MNVNISNTDLSAFRFTVAVKEVFSLYILLMDCIYHDIFAIWTAVVV